jgi:hypothetical protein
MNLSRPNSTLHSSLKTIVDLEYLARKWPSEIVAREMIGQFSGGLLHPRTMANHDSKGTGPEGAIRCGRKIAYPVGSLINWMQERAAPAREV